MSWIGCVAGQFVYEPPYTTGPLASDGHGSPANTNPRMDFSFFGMQIQGIN